MQVQPHLFFLVILACAAGCKKNTPAPSTSSVAATREAGSADEHVLNDFLEKGRSPQEEEQAMLEAIAGQGGDAGKEPVPVVSVVEPGAEPSTKMGYDFALNRPETVVLTVKSSMTRTQAGRPPERPPADPGLQFGLTVTAKSRSDKGDTRFEVVISKAGWLDAAIPKEVLAQTDPLFKSVTGMKATFVANRQGAIREIEFSPNAKAPEEAMQLLPVVGQAFEMLLVPFPDAPIGEGARWKQVVRHAQGQIPITSTSEYTLKKKDAATATVTTSTTRSSPSQWMESAQQPQGMFVEVKGGGTYTYTVSFKGVSTKVEGETTTDQIVRDSAAGPPRATVSMTMGQSLTKQAAP